MAASICSHVNDVLPFKPQMRGLGLFLPSLAESIHSRLQQLAVHLLYSLAVL